MSNQAFDVTLSDFSNFDWQSLVAAAPPLPFHEYWNRFFRAAASHEQKNDSRGAKVFSFLGAVCGLAPNWSSRQKPFGPRVIMEAVRSADITDFAEAERSVLAGLIPTTNDPQLRARFADVACAIKFDHNLARTAASAYLEVVRLFAEHDNWPNFFDYLERAGQLAASVGKSHQEFKDFVNEANQLLERFRPDDTGFACSKILDLLLEHNEADPATHAPFSVELAQRAQQNKKFLVARAYWQLGATFNRQLKDEQKARECLIQSGETHVSEALEFLSGDKVSHGATAYHFGCAVSALTSAGAPRERIEELHRRMIEEQKLSMQEMAHFSTPQIDLSELSNAARELVRNKDLQAALFALAFGVKLTDFEDFKRIVRETASEHPFLAMVPVATADSQGRTTARRPSLWKASEGGSEEAVLLEVFHRVSTIQWPITSKSFIEPAARQIWVEHHPDDRDLAFLVMNNPVVPPGHHDSFLRGFQAGLSGDMHTAAYFLVPQFEALVRHVLALHNVITSKLDNQLIQDLRLLGMLLQLPETSEVFGANTVLTMRGLLIEPFGSNLRNDLTHGLLSDGACYQPNVLYSWWLLLRLCVFPIAQAQEARSDDPPQPKA
jgi:hypothetical protein